MLVLFPSSYETKGKSDTSSNHAVLKLAKGDEVWLRMGNGALHGDHQRFSTFAGFLLFGKLSKTMNRPAPLWERLIAEMVLSRSRDF